ncbi:MAG TPA: translation initiation factor IF-2 [Gaiellaceae bacterium]
MANGRPNRPIRPRGGGPAGRKRRVVIDSGGQRPRPGDQRQRPGQRQDGGKREQQQAVQPTGPVTVESGVTVRDFSQALGVPMSEIIKALMNLGQMRTATQSLSDEEVELIAAELQREVTIKHAAEEEEAPSFEDTEESLVARPPVVTIMGHVDHGKTTLLDAIRKTAVVATEAGGITQHIGAYQTTVDGRRITFLDTPGHEAFTAMRARGAKVTDIAVLVVAADDGVMPQTRESISHARAADVPIVVAVNKIDLPDANPDRVLAELAQEGLQPSEWGGDVEVARVSAKQGEGLEDLLEKILVVGEVLVDLRANPNAEASGPVIESRLDVGRGPVATILVHRGTLRVGDAIVAGDAWGRVRALYDYRGEKVKEAKPGDPVEVVGFDKAPPSGELARVVENERHARQVANSRSERLRREQLATQSRRRVTLEGLFAEMESGAVKELNLVLKGDVQGSVEAAVSELAKIQHSEVRVNVIHTGVGGITQNDINLAAASDALVVGFNVRPNAEARQLAEREGVEIRTYRVIYQLTQDIEQALVGMLSAVTTEETVGEVEVRALFRASRVGVIAGCYVTSGVVRSNSQVRVVRDGTVIYETTIASLRRVKDDVREVREGFECGIVLENFNDLREGDIFEAFETREVERTSLDEPAAQS